MTPPLSASSSKKLVRGCSRPQVGGCRRGAGHNKAAGLCLKAAPSPVLQGPEKASHQQQPPAGRPLPRVLCPRPPSRAGTRLLRQVILEGRDKGLRGAAAAEEEHRVAGLQGTAEGKGRRKQVPTLRITPCSSHSCGVVAPGPAGPLTAAAAPAPAVSPTCSSCSADSAPRWPRLKLSMNRTQLRSSGTVVPPEVTTATGLPPLLGPLLLLVAPAPPPLSGASPVAEAARKARRGPPSVRAVAGESGGASAKNWVGV